VKKQLREIVFNKCNEHCAYCGEELEYKNMQVDHIIPQRNFLIDITSESRTPGFLKHLTAKDLNHIDNLNPSCRICNKRKDTFHLELFRKEIASQVERAIKSSSNYRIAKRYGLIKETPKPIVFYFETLKTIKQ